MNNVADKTQDVFDRNSLEQSFPGVAAQSPAFMPVILGGDIGAYSLARATYEAYGIKALVISQTKSHLIHDSSILTNWVVPDMDKAREFLTTLYRVRQTYTDRALLLLACSDWYVSLISAHREKLDPHFVIPYASPATLDRLTKKERFYELCEHLDIPYPATTLIHFGEEDAVTMKAHIAELDAGFPLIAKPENSGAYHYATFAGKRKVFTLESQMELDGFLRTMQTAYYNGKFLIQQFIPGDDSAMRILTTYSNQGGKVRFHAQGQTLLEDHHPLGIGNPVAIRTLKQPQIVEDAKKLLEQVGYTGFANFDIKVDPATGKHYFFEANTRLGRSNFYVTARGYNVISWMVNDLILHEALDETISADEADLLFTLLPKETLLAHISDPVLRSTAAAYFTTGQAFNPVENPQEHNLLRRLYPYIYRMKQRRAFAKHPGSAQQEKHPGLQPTAPISEETTAADSTLLVQMSAL